MPVFELDERILFPPAELADPDGLLAVGGDLRAERVLLAYASGIFPWPSEGLPLLWHSPDPRFVLEPAHLHVPRRLAREIRKARFTLTLDTDFAAVIRSCALKPRPGQNGTWITSDMVDAYIAVHELGFAHSLEVWRDDRLVGGLYGVSLGGAFFGESMFAHEADASKVGFVCFVRQLASWGMSLVDAQVHTPHLERFGASHWSRERYLQQLVQVLSQPTRQGKWSFDRATTT